MISQILKRRDYFDKVFPPLVGNDYRNDISFSLSNSCPSCGYLTIEERCVFNICRFCFWEDDGQDNHDANEVFGGPNSDYSLTAHRLEFYDWMEELKKNADEDKSLKSNIGNELKVLDGYIEREEKNFQIVLDQIEKLAQLFDKFRSIATDEILSWKFKS